MSLLGMLCLSALGLWGVLLASCLLGSEVLVAALALQFVLCCSVMRCWAGRPPSCMVGHYVQYRHPCKAHLVCLLWGNGLQAIPCS